MTRSRSDRLGKTVDVCGRSKKHVHTSTDVPECHIKGTVVVVYVCVIANPGRPWTRWTWLPPGVGRRARLPGQWPPEKGLSNGPRSRCLRVDCRVATAVSANAPRTCTWNRTARPNFPAQTAVCAPPLEYA
jgi:hypothetical protein